MREICTPGSARGDGAKRQEPQGPVPTSHVLVASAREQLGLDALRSAIVLFVNRDRTRCTRIFHDGSGLVILYKRLDAGRFQLPLATVAGDRAVRLDARELALALEGVARR